jgi:hypothetical protein
MPSSLLRNKRRLAETFAPSRQSISDPTITLFRATTFLVAVLSHRSGDSRDTDDGWNKKRKLASKVLAEMPREEDFTWSLDIDALFGLPDHLTEHYQNRLLEVVYEGGNDDLGDDATLTSCIRATLITEDECYRTFQLQDGTVGAIPYPGRVAEAPKSLEELIRDAVESISF